jgi:threonine dehydrogenase-like Zn-dependent dehydrogenase
MSLDLVCTHQLRYQVGGAEVVDGIAWATGPAGAVVRFFVPGFLPCGECPLCRRGLVGACPLATRPLVGGADLPAPTSTRGRALALPDRFLAAVDEPPGVAVLPDEIAVMAGVVAFALHAIAAASLAPGDFVIWLGAGPIAIAGAALATGRGANSFSLCGEDDSGRAGAADVNLGQLADHLATLAAVPATVHGSRKRVLVLTQPNARTWSDAARLGEPGATFVVLGDAGQSLPGPLALPAESRVLLLAAGHPDFVPESLAALRSLEFRPTVELLRQDLRDTAAGSASRSRTP